MLQLRINLKTTLYVLSFFYTGKRDEEIHGMKSIHFLEVVENHFAIKVIKISTLSKHTISLPQKNYKL